MDFNFRRTYRGPLKAAILDWAGTTVDYGCCAPAVVFIEVFKQKGVDITIEESRQPMGAAKREHIAAISRMPRVAEAWQTTHGAPCSESDIDALYQDFIPRQINCIGDYADLIPGTLEAQTDLRQRKMLIGTTTGYSADMANTLIPLAKKQGYAPDSNVTASDVPAGRPAPWMAVKSAMDMNVFPMEAIVKIGDTVPDIGEGLNASMWTIGVAKTGNEVGLSEADLEKTAPDALERLLVQARKRLAEAGAHYVVDGIAEVPAILDEISTRLAMGEHP